MRGNQWHARQSAVLSGHQRPSAAISGTHLRGLGSVIISGHQWSSVVISGHQRPSAVRTCAVWDRTSNSGRKKK